MIFLAKKANHHLAVLAIYKVENVPLIRWNKRGMRFNAPWIENISFA